MNEAPGLPRRLAAMLYDTFLVLPLIMLMVALAMAIQIALGPPCEPPLPDWLVRAIAVLCCLGFYGVFWLKGGQTLGMQAWRIRLVAFDGGDITPLQVLRRIGGALLSAACLGCGFWWCLLDSKHRYWHDYLSGTELRLVAKKQKGSGDSGPTQQ